MGRIMGHRRGAESVRATVRTCRRLGIGYLTLYAFSMENWLRPEAEVSALMMLLKEYLDSEIQEMMDRDIRFTAVGDLKAIGEPIYTTLLETAKKTAGNKGMVLNLALSYGGRDEIAAAARGIVVDALAGRVKPEDVSKNLLAGYLYTAGMPDPDLLIRTGGECRVSNFLLWQIAYAELFFSNVLWPDFREEHLLEAIAEYQSRERRFGMTGDQVRQR